LDEAGQVPPSRAYRGAALGLAERGPGSLAPLDRRILAFAIDSVGSGLVAALFVRRRDLPGLASHLPGQWSLLALFVEYVIGLVLLGRSAGMLLTGLRVIRLRRNVAVGPLRAALRTALLMLVVPALLLDRDLRGMHDRLTDTAVITQ
jgi:hypothetical protein